MMIEGLKQQQLTFDKGITNVPSDAVCSDNTLQDCVGLAYEDGEHRVIQKPADYYAQWPEGHTLLYVHEYGGFTRYITTRQGRLYWIYNNTTHEIGSCTGSVSVESIGNTVIVSDESSLTYLLWDTKRTDPQYKSIGNAIPQVGMKFYMQDVGDSSVVYHDNCIDLSPFFHGIIVRDAGVATVSVSGKSFASYEDAKSGLIGIVSKRLDEVKEAKRFAFPFWVRYATRLYDGTYTHISNPILMMPTVRNNWNIFISDENGNIRTLDGDAGSWGLTNYLPVSAKLCYEFTNYSSLEDWSDIVSGVDIFVSEEVKTFDLEGEWSIQNSYEPANTINPVFAANTFLSDSCSPEYNSVKYIHAPSSSYTLDYCYTYFQPSLLSDSEIIKKLIDKSVFYLLVETDLEDITAGIKDSTDTIQRGVMDNLTTQTQLDTDDYYSYASMQASIIKSYNNRLHLANVKRTFFDGFANFSFTSYETSEGIKEYIYYVYIKTDSGLRIVSNSINSLEIADVWFYYPDPRAFRVMIFNTTDDKLLFDSRLKEHPALNGAYAFSKLPSVVGEQRPTTIADEPDVIDQYEVITDRVFVSEVDNPYVFTSKGDVTIRMGAIVGLATQTMALGEMEHGLHPLIVFSEKGISMLRLADDGTYMRSDEVSREAAYPDNPCITETDGPVFFASHKGLMVIAGSQVKCVSEQLSGKSEAPFQDYLKNAFIAYDYRDSLLWIFDGATHTVNGTSSVGSCYCWIYSIKSGTFCRYDFGENVVIVNAVNNYPDYLLQNGNTLYSLLRRPNINSVTELQNSYAAYMITRPMKLENAMALKSIMQVRHISDMEGMMTMRIFASNNLDNWIELHSLGGMPWKYYRFRYDFSNLKATDRFAGTLLITQERRTDKLR